MFARNFYVLGENERPQTYLLRKSSYASPQSGETPEMIYANPNTDGSLVTYKARYGNYIGGEFVPPVDGDYFENVSPVNGKTFCEIPRSRARDIELALDAAHRAKEAWGKTSYATRANLLNKIADRMEANLEMLAVGRDVGQRQGGS